MNTERDELALTMRQNFSGWMGSAVSYDVADAILAAGYSKPRLVYTVEELDALAFQSVVRDAEGYVLERWGEPEDHMWATPMNGAWIRSAEVVLPATVLYEGAQP